MELEILKKKISTFRGEGGRVRITDDSLMMEILRAWEQWTAPSDGFYKAIGVSAKGMASVIGRAKKLKREGFPTDGFKEIKLEQPALAGGGSCISDLTGAIELNWDQGKIIRFPHVDQLVDFLKKVS